jgi:TonB-dependent SusC/RagA subfamily outer membrane receptor
MKPKIFLCILLSILSVANSIGQKNNKKLSITGFVLDSNQKPVSGAMIFIDNVRTDAISNGKGFYRVKVNPNAVSISAFSQTNGLDEAEIGGRTTINLNLKTSGLTSKPKVQNLTDDETINVGYGTVKRKDLTTTVGKIDATNKRFASYHDIYEMIRGELPGVQVRGKSIMIQGPTSINLSSEPLFVVDGVIVTSVDYIFPQEVKSIEVLKGSAASIYGSRGANGVILINLIGSGDIKK